MDKQKITEAFDLLRNALDEDDDDNKVTLKLTMSKRDLKVLRTICRADISVPNEVSDSFPHVSYDEVHDVLHCVALEIDRR